MIRISSIFDGYKMMPFSMAALLCSFLSLGTAKDCHDFCIVGAGAAGIQLAHMLQLKGQDYLVLERNGLAGSFFSKYPKQGGLISINKKYTGKSDPEFNLRHDWNSLLTSEDGNSGTEFKFTDLTDEYWPHRSYIVDYLNQFAEKYQLNVQYNTDVETVTKDDDDTGAFQLEITVTDGDTKKKEMKTCKKLIWATGFSQPRTFPSKKIVPYHEMAPAIEYQNRSVVILGAGQSAFEAARALYKVTSNVMIMYRTPPKFAYNTHYPGDIRVMNQEIIDSYSLKSLDALSDLGDDYKNKLIELTLNPYADVIISCIGWSMDPKPLWKLEPEMMTLKRKSDQFPAMDATYQSTNVPGLYFAGVLTHSNDKDKSAGGFIHGYRYTARALSRMLTATPEEPWPIRTVACFDEEKNSIENVKYMSQQILKRVGISSGLYQMQSELQDIFLYTNEGCLLRLEEVPQRYTPELIQKLPMAQASSIFTLTFRYNTEFSKSHRDVFQRDRVQPQELHPDMPENLQFEVMPHGWDKMNFLHPVLETLQYYANNDITNADCTRFLNTPFHMMEDLDTEWKRTIDIASIMEFLLVRTLSNPCEFDSAGSLGGEMKEVWKTAKYPNPLAAYLPKYSPLG